MHTSQREQNRTSKTILHFTIYVAFVMNNVKHKHTNKEGGEPLTMESRTRSNISSKSSCRLRQIALGPERIKQSRAALSYNFNYQTKPDRSSICLDGSATAANICPIPQQLCREALLLFLVYPSMCFFVCIDVSPALPLFASYQ